MALLMSAGLAEAGDPTTSPTMSVDEAARAIAAKNSTPYSRAYAAAILGFAWGDTDRAKAVTALVPAVDDESPSVRASVANALGRLADDKALPALAQRVAVEKEDDPLVAQILAIGSIGRRPALPSVLPFADRPSARVRAATATALGDLGGEDARRRLLALLGKPGPGDDADWTVRSAVLIALSKCGKPEDSGAILVAYRDGGGEASWFARAALAQAVGALDSNPVPILDRLMADDDPRVSSAAGVALARSGRPDEVVKRLADPRDGVRSAAAAAVAGAEIRAALPQLKKVALDDAVRAVRWSAAMALSRLDDPISDALLVQGIGSDDPAVWAAALAECRRKTGDDTGRDPDAWKKVLEERRARLVR